MQDIKAEMAQQDATEEHLEFLLRDAIVRMYLDDDTVLCIGNTKTAFCDEPLRSSLRNEILMRDSTLLHATSVRSM